MIIHEIDNWDSLRKELFETKKRAIKEGSTEYAQLKLYSGHKDIKWKLQSKLERQFDGSNFQDQELNVKKMNQNSNWSFESVGKAILNQFKQNLVRISSEYENISDDEAMILGRHHDLSTPILDWTTNPLKALFFALEEPYLGYTYNFPTYNLHIMHDDKPFVVFKLNCYNDIFNDDEFKIIQSINEIGSRMHAQSAWLTELRTNDYVCLEDYLEDIGKGDYLEKFIIDSKLIKEIIFHLHESEISAFSMYPDLKGAALDANTNMIGKYSLNQITKNS